MNKTIYVFAGKANAGKDTAASMACYIARVGTARANYKNWENFYKPEVVKDASPVRHNIFHFADSLKDSLSIIFGIDRKLFDDRDYKDNKYYCMATGNFMDENSINEKYYRVTTINDFYEKDLNDIINETLPSGRVPIFTLRTLMQYFGTDLCRKRLFNTVWIRSTLSAISSKLDMAVINKFVAIADCRFDEEIRAVRRLSIHSKIIYIDRPNKQQEFNHSSNGQILEPIDNVIKNDGTLMKLFFTILQIMTEDKERL